MTARPPAVVLGTGLTALGVTRSLAREDVPVRHLSPGAGVLLRASRWYRPLVEDPPPAIEEDAARLEEVVESAADPGSVLFPCSDAFVVTVGSTSRSFRERHVPYLADGDVLEALVDKAGLADLARRAEVPIPATVTVGSERELDELEEEWFRDSLLKPVDSQRFYRRFGVKSLPVTGREQAREAYRRFRDEGMEPVLQRYVPGPPSAHLFVDGYRSGAGVFEGRLVRRRERMYPPRTGNSSSTVTVPPADGAAATGHLERLFEQAGFRGIFSAEFKEDAGDGTVRLLEVNVRPWWYVEFAANCGVNVCAMAYREAAGRPVEGADGYDVGRRCVYGYYDLHAGWSELRAGRLSARAWLTSWIGADRPVFARDDPAPAVRAAWTRVRRSLRRRLDRLGGTAARERAA